MQPSRGRRTSRYPQHCQRADLESYSRYYRRDPFLQRFGELSLQQSTSSGSPLATFNYEAGVARDHLGRVVRKVEQLPGFTTTYDYTYDANRRLTDVKQDNVLVEHIDYDANGNRVARTTPSTGTVHGSCDSQDRLLTFGSLTFNYTANGELKSKTDTTTGAQTQYQYDALGNLLKVTLPSGTVVDYLVDALGRRVGKKINGTVIKQWLYRDGLKPVAELDGAGALVSQFVYGSSANVPDYVVKSGSTYRILTDHLGSLRLVVNVNTGAVAQRMRHDAWGNLLEDNAPGFVPFGFAGGIYDPDTALMRFGARDYDPSVGRWTNKDPIRFEAGQANLYAYVGDDPVGNADPSGLEVIYDSHCFAECMIPKDNEYSRCGGECQRIPPGPDRERCQNVCYLLFEQAQRDCAEKCQIICGE